LVPERAEYFPAKTKCSPGRNCHEMIPNEMQVTRPDYAFRPGKGAQTWRFVESTHETQQNHEISKCFVPPYSTSFRNVEPQVVGCYSEQVLRITYGCQSFYKPLFSRDVSRTASYPIQGNAPPPVMFLPGNQFSMPDPYLPEFEGLRNGQVHEDNSNHTNYSAPRCDMALPYYFNRRKSHHKTQTEMTAFWSQSCSRVIDCQLQEREVEPVSGTWCHPEAAVNQENTAVARSSVPYSCTTSSQAEQVPIFKTATISPLPGRKDPYKQRSKFAASAESLNLHEQKGSGIEKSVDFRYCEEKYDLCDAPIFQILCETTTV